MKTEQRAVLDEIGIITGLNFVKKQMKQLEEGK